MSQNINELLGASMSKVREMVDANTVVGTPISEETSAAMRQLLENAVENGFAVLYITEDLLREIPESYEKFKTEPMLAIIPIPSKTGSLGIGMALIKRSVERAVGADILKD